MVLAQIYDLVGIPIEVSWIDDYLPLVKCSFESIENEYTKDDDKESRFRDPTISIILLDFPVNL